MPTVVIRDVRSPCPIKLRACISVEDVLEAGELVGDGAHVAAALNIVLAPQRVQPGPVATDMTAQQRQVDEGQDVVDTIVMLGNAKGPAQLCAWRLGVGVGKLADGFSRYAGDKFANVERPRFDAGLIRLKVAGGPIDEALVGEACRDDLSSNRVGERDIGADVQAEPSVSPTSRRRATGIHHEKLGSVTNPRHDVMEEDGVRLTSV